MDLQPQYRLQLRHECKWISCKDPTCGLCRESTDRCFHDFSTSQIVRSVKRNDKISAGACVFKADCGAPISLTLIRLDGSDNPYRVKPPPNETLKLQFTLVEYTDNLERNLTGVEYPNLRDVQTQILPMQLGRRQLLKASMPANTPETYDQDEQLVLPFELMDHPPQLPAQDQAFSKPVNVYVDTPLRDIVNRLSERVKRVGLLVRVVLPESQTLNILPALSSPFMLYTRRRDAKDTIPRPSDRVRDLSDMSDATCARLINLRQSAIDQQVEVDCRLLPEEPISTAGQMYDFLKDKPEEFLAVVSMKVLKRPKDCLLNLRKELDGKMIKMENDQRLRKWQAEGENCCLYYAAYKGVCVLDLTSTNPQVCDKDARKYIAVPNDPNDILRRQLHHRAEQAWHLPGHPGWSIDEQPPNNHQKYASTVTVPQQPKPPVWPRTHQPLLRPMAVGHSLLPQRPGGPPPGFSSGLSSPLAYSNMGWANPAGVRGQLSMPNQLAQAWASPANPLGGQPSSQQSSQMQGPAYPPGAYPPGSRPPPVQWSPGLLQGQSLGGSGKSTLHGSSQAPAFPWTQWGGAAPSATSGQTSSNPLGAYQPPTFPGSYSGAPSSMPAGFPGVVTPLYTGSMSLKDMTARPAALQGSQPSLHPPTPISKPSATLTYRATATLAVPNACPDWQGHVKLTFAPMPSAADPSPRPEVELLNLGPNFRFGTEPQALDLVFQLPYALGGMVLEKDPGGAPCWLWLESVVVHSASSPPLTYCYNVEAGCDLSRTRVSVAGTALSPNSGLSSFWGLSGVVEREQLLDACGDAASFAQKLGLQEGVPAGILECQKQALSRAMKCEALSSDKWRSKLFFTLREAGCVVELEVCTHERKSRANTPRIRLKTPPTSVNSLGSATMFSASVDLSGNFDPDVILVKLTTAAQVVDSEKGHLLSSMRLEAQVQKGFIRLYDFGPPHAVGELWVFQCSNRSKPLPLSEKIPDKEYAELAVEKVKPPPKQEARPPASLGPMEGQASRAPPNGPQAADPQRLQNRSLATAGNATWPGSSKGSIQAGQSFLRSQQNPALAPPNGPIGAAGTSASPGNASPGWVGGPLSPWKRDPKSATSPPVTDAQEAAAAGVARTTGGVRSAHPAPPPKGMGQGGAPPGGPPSMPPRPPHALSENLLNPADTATATYKRLAGTMAALFEEIAQLPALFMPMTGKEPRSALQVEMCKQLRRTLAPKDDLFRGLLEPQYRCVLVGQSGSGKSSLVEAFKELAIIYSDFSRSAPPNNLVSQLLGGASERQVIVAGTTLQLVDTPGLLEENARREVDRQLAIADAVFLVLDYDCLDASMEWGHHLLRDLELDGRLNVVVNKVEDISMIRREDSEPGIVARVRENFASRGLALPTSQIWLLSAQEARMCVSIRLRQAGMLRQAGRVQDRLFQHMIWGRMGIPPGMTENDFVREVEKAFAKSGLGRLGRDIVRRLHEGVGMRRLTAKIEKAEARLAKAKEYCTVFSSVLSHFFQPLGRRYQQAVMEFEMKIVNIVRDLDNLSQSEARPPESAEKELSAARTCTERILEFQQSLVKAMEDATKFTEYPPAVEAPPSQDRLPRQQRLPPIEARPPGVPMTSGRAEASEQGLGKRSVQQLEAETASLPPVATAPKRQKKVATAPPQLAVPTGKEGKLQKSCMNCGTKSTPVWRSGPNGPKTLCNACGVSHKRGEDNERLNQMKNARTSPRLGTEGAAPLRASARQVEFPRKVTARRAQMERNQALAGVGASGTVVPEEEVAALLMNLSCPQEESHSRTASEPRAFPRPSRQGKGRRSAGATPEPAQQDSDSDDAAVDDFSSGLLESLQKRNWAEEEVVDAASNPMEHFHNLKSQDGIVAIGKEGINGLFVLSEAADQGGDAVAGFHVEGMRQRYTPPV